VRVSLEIRCVEPVERTDKEVRDTLRWRGTDGTMAGDLREQYDGMRDTRDKGVPKATVVDE